ncbi:MAG: hypothetical protein Q7S16_04190 [bacterium]|nr:hypothetical protein [bacterium]
MDLNQRTTQISSKPFPWGTIVKVVGVIFGVILLFCVLTAIITVTNYNSLVSQEEEIMGVDKDMQNVHASVYKQMRGQGLSFEKYGATVIEAMRVGAEGRFGKNGSQAAVLWIQEQNLDISANVMLKLQQTIEAGYNKFEATQRTKIDKLTTYKKSLRRFPRNIVAWIFGFPKIDMNIAERIVTSAETKKDFETLELSDPDPFGERDK